MTDTPTAPPGPASPEPPPMMDIEASGFGRDSYPIEIGFVLADGSSYCTLVRPAPGWTHWDAEAEKLHRIALKTVLEHGRDAVEVARQLNERLRGQTLYCDGWAHDYAWLNALYEAVGLTPAFRLDNLRGLLTEQEAAFFNIVKRQVTTEMRLPRHRASSDARILQMTLMRMRAPLGAVPAGPAKDEPAPGDSPRR